MAKIFSILVAKELNKLFFRLQVWGLKGKVLSLFFFLVFWGGSQVSGQIVNGPWIDTVYRKIITAPPWPIEFLRFNLDGQLGPQPFGLQGWEVMNFPLPSDTSIRISHPRFFAQMVRNNRWFVLPPITLENLSYEFVWKSKAGSGTINGNGGYKIWVSDFSGLITTGNIESAFSNIVFKLAHEVGQDIPGPFFYTPHSTGLNAFRNKTIRIAFQNTDSLLTSVSFKEFLVRSKPLHDLSVAKILAPRLPCKLKSNEKIGVAIRNQGGVYANGFSVSLYNNGNLIETRTITDSLRFDLEDTISFFVNMAIPGLYRFKAIVKHLPDTLSFNDTLELNYLHRAPANLAIKGWKEDFINLDTLMTRIVDRNADGATWGWTKLPPYNSANSDELMYPMYPKWPQVNGDDWFIGGCMSMQKDSVYNLSVDWRNERQTNQYKLFVYLGREATPDSLHKKISETTHAQGIFQNFANTFTAPSTDVYFIGVQTIKQSTNVASTYLKEVRVSKQKARDLALTRVFQPGDSVYACPGSGQGMKVEVKNLGKEPFPFPAFLVEVNGPGGIQNYYGIQQTVIPSGSRSVVPLDAQIDFSLPGIYSIVVINKSVEDQETSNDTIRSTFRVYPPKQANYVEQFNGASATPPADWWVMPSTGYILGNMLFWQFYGANNQKYRFEAVSPQFTGLGSASHFVVDNRYQTLATGNILPLGDTLDFLVSVNCGPFVSLKRFLPGIQRPTTMVPVYIDLSSLNILPSDKVALKLKATHLAQGIDMMVYYDNIRIEQVTAFDAQVQSPAWYPYSRVSQKHKVTFTPSFQAFNGGTTALSPLVNRCIIAPAGYNEALNTNIGINIASFQPIGFPVFLPQTNDTFSLTYSVQTASFQPDGIPENNSATSTFILCDSTLARDYGSSTMGQGFITTGGRGMIGQVFSLLTPDTLTSMEVFFDSLPVLTRVRPVVYACNPTTGVPNNFPLDSNWNVTNIGTASSKSWRFFNLRREADQNRGLALPAGKYFIGLIQKQSFMAIGSNLVTAEKRTIYKRNSAAPGNAWTLIDTVGQLFVRANFGTRIMVGNQNKIEKNEKLRIFPNPANQQIIVERMNDSKPETAFVFNILGQLVKQVLLSESKQELDISNLPPGFYRIQISDLGKGFIKE